MIFLWAPTSGEEPDISLSIVNSKARLCLDMSTHYACIVSLKLSNVFNTHSKCFICRRIEHVTSCKGIIASGVAARDDCGVAGERRLIGVPKFL